MAIVTNTFTRYDAKGIREDLANVIYNISPEETPFQSNVARTNVKNTFFEWQTDSLAAASTTNAALEGDDIGTFDQTSPTTRLGNYTQISVKTVVISGTLESVDKAGRRSEMAYQMAKRGAELKRDMEAVLLASKAANAGNNTTARQTAGLPAFLRTNTSKGANGVDPTVSNGVVNATRVDGTQRTFTETILKDVISKVWTQGGSPKVLMTGPFNKQTVSGFAGIAGIRYNQATPKPSVIIGAADVYVSDFGSVSVVPNRFQRERDAFVLDPEYAATAILRPIQSTELAKTGDAEKRMMLCEYGLMVRQEAAHGIAADLTTA